MPEDGGMMGGRDGGGSKRDPGEIMDGDEEKDQGTEENRGRVGHSMAKDRKVGFLLLLPPCDDAGCVTLRRISTSRARLAGNGRRRRV